MKKKVLIVTLFASILSLESIFASEGQNNDSSRDSVINYESMDILEVQARDFSVEEILNAYFGEEKWNPNLLVQQAYGEKGKNWYIESEYSDENVKISCMCDDFGFFDFEIEYKNEEYKIEKMMNEWLSMIDRLNIVVDNQYKKKTDEINNIVRYVYRVKQNSLVVGDEVIIIGSAGNETDYPAPVLNVTLTDGGYTVMANFITDIVQKNNAGERQLQTEEKVKENFIEYIKELYSEAWDEIELQDDTFESEIVYIPVDQGQKKYSYVYDIAYEVKMMAIYEENTQMEMGGYIDAQYPYCYYGYIANTDDQTFQIEYYSIVKETKKLIRKKVRR